MAAFRSRPQRPFLSYLARNNPFYLLSAACMLLACLLLSNTTTWSPIGLPKLLGLIATLNFYELLLVALGLFLVARRGLVRDGFMLLVLEAFFLADIGFLDSEAYQESLRAGLLVSGGVMVLALLKFGAIFRTLHWPIRSPVFALILLASAGLLFHPALLKMLSDQRGGIVLPNVMYGLWWIVALMFAAYGVLMRKEFFAAFKRGQTQNWQALCHSIVLILLASSVAHLGTAHWVYKCTFTSPDLSPTLIGLAVLLCSLPASRWIPRPQAQALFGLFIVSALMLVREATGRLAYVFGPFSVTPGEMTLAAAYLAVIYNWALRYFWQYTVLGAVAVFTYSVAPSLQTIEDALTAGGRWTGAKLSVLIPRTQWAWGAIALAGAFVMLAVGAVLSLMHSDRQLNDDLPINLPPASGAT